MLDAVLINPCLFKKKKNIWKKIDSCFPSLGLASIAAYVRQKGFSVRIIDAPAWQLSVDSFENFLRLNYSYYQARYFGFTAATPSVKNAYAMAEIVRKVYPSAKIVFGGIHATVLPEEVAEQADIVVRGEGEITFSEILSGRELPMIAGIVYQAEGRIVSNPERERIGNLDGIPFSAYDLLPMDKYYPAKGSYKKLPAMSMLASRGCPGRCTFCGKTLGQRMVFRSAESLVEEIELLARDYGIRQIMFYDDTFTVHQENVRRFCRLLLERRLDISWCCFSRVDYIDLELLKLMKESGCHQIMYGIESGDQEVLDSINKKVGLDLVKEAVVLTKKVGIDIRGAFMLGSPVETRETILKTLDFALELDPELAVFNITTPYPGTAMFEQASREGMITTYDWDDYDLSKLVMRLKNIGREEILELYRHCYRKFYFRPRYIFMRLKRLAGNPGEIRLVFDSLKAIFKFVKE